MEEKDLQKLKGMIQRLDSMDYSPKRAWFNYDKRVDQVAKCIEDRDSIVVFSSQIVACEEENEAGVIGFRRFKISWLIDYKCTSILIRILKLPSTQRYNIEQNMDEIMYEYCKETEKLILLTSYIHLLSTEYSFILWNLSMRYTIGAK